ncbi:hypothetical protein FB597_1166 [Herbaspirillum sp. SJZ099]|nr:hypothetical protein FB597_1166 [Herbaspirillum sp. SJZ099]
MQALHRNGEGRDQGVGVDAHADAGAGSSVPQEAGRSMSAVADDELEIRASQITAAAVAAAAVTAAVATAAEADAPGRFDAPATAPIPQPQSRFQTGPGTAASVADAQEPMPHGAAASPQRALPVSLLTLVAIGLALWWSAQWPWPERALKPMAPHLPSLRKQTVAPPVAAPLAAATTESRATLAGDEIAILQQEAEQKAQLLAQKRAAAEARRRREDTALALREQRRREAEAQLAAARAKAERVQQAAPQQPMVADTPAVPTLAEQVQQCRALSLFAREGCLWKLCNGKWGKDGCPSYERNNEGA